jgi:hypothetical protein
MVAVTEFEILNFARPLDVHTWSDYSEVNTFVELVFEDLKGLDGNRKTILKLLKVVLLDLYVAWCSDPKLKLMFSRDNNAYAAKSRYSELFIGKKIIEVVDALVVCGWVNEKRGFNDRDTGSAFLTRIWPTTSLIAHFKTAKFHQFHVQNHEEREVIILRNEDKENVEYVDDDQDLDLAVMRTLLRDYNLLLDRTHIDIETLEEPVIPLGEGKAKRFLPINQRSKFVNRIFNNSRWDHGGRFYGGWWQRCPKEWRKAIAFDGVSAMELDYSGLHIVILYAQEGINYWKDIGEDPYQVDQVEAFDPEIDIRSAAKSLLLTAINADSETKAFGAFRNESETGSAQKRMKDKELALLLDQLKKKHSAISHKIASGAGIGLMYIDSQITERLIKRFTYHYKCPMLSVHDSYLVPFGYDRILHEEMCNAFCEVTGMSDPNIKHTEDYYDIVQAGFPPGEEPEDFVPPSPSERHRKERELFNEFKDKPSAEDWHPDWTMIY